MKIRFNITKNIVLILRVMHNSAPGTSGSLRLFSLALKNEKLEKLAYVGSLLNKQFITNEFKLFKFYSKLAFGNESHSR